MIHKMYGGQDIHQTFVNNTNLWYNVRLLYINKSSILVIIIKKKEKEKRTRGNT